MTALSLQSPASPALAAGAATSPHSGRGSAAAEGITNPGRLLGLGLALGIGAEVFGAPGPAASPADMAADLSPLSPLLSKSQMRRLQRRASSGAPAAPASTPLGGSGAGLAAGVAAAGSGSGRQQHQQPGRKGKPGRSKQERRTRSSGAYAGIAAAAGAPAGPTSSGDDQQQQQHMGLGASADGSARLGSAGGSDSGGRALVSGEYGYFERHTTGIGSKLLAKWGFAGEGAGLGRGQQGRAEPLQAVRRAKKLGLGAER